MNFRESSSRFAGGFFLHGWRVDPSGRGQLVRLWHAVFEAVRCALEGDGQRCLLLAHLGCTAGVDALRRHQANAGMPVLLVVPSEEHGALGPRIAAGRQQIAVALRQVDQDAADSVSTNGLPSSPGATNTGTLAFGLSATKVSGN